MYKKLEEIVTKIKEDLIIKKQQAKSNDSFIKAIISPKKGSLAIIAEIKLASPTQPNLGSRLDIQKRVKEYELAGVSAISVVTEKHFFKGDLSFVRDIKDTVSLPILQKDFIIDPYQVYEAKIAGADALLLIAKILPEKDLLFLVNLTIELGIEPVVETNNKEDLKRAFLTKTQIIAVNARDLDTFEIDIDRACELIKLIPQKYIKLGFSGVSEKKDAQKYKDAGADGILIGTSLMKTSDVSGFLERISI